MNKLRILLAALLFSFAVVPGLHGGDSGSFASDRQEVNENWEQNYESDAPGSIRETTQRLPLGTVGLAILMLGAFAGCLILEAKH
jgi:hypothetical protein